MSVSARVASGIQAIHVVVTDQGRTFNAVIPREALEECWDVGPDQADLLNTFLAHQKEITAQVRHHAQSARGQVIVIKELAKAERASLSRIDA